MRLHRWLYFIVEFISMYAHGRILFLLKLSMLCCLLILLISESNYQGEIFSYNFESKQPSLFITPANTSMDFLKTTSDMIQNLTIASPVLDWLVWAENRRKSAINCASIFSGNKTEMKKARTINYTAISDLSMKSATSDCTAYKKARGYIMSNVPEDERKFPIAYSILTYDRIDQLERLLRAIYRPQNVYCIHVDRKSKPHFVDAVKGLADCLPNVFLTLKREVVVYAGFTRLQADLNCFKDLLKYDWKYALNYASSEFPLWPNRDLVTILRLLNGSNIFQRKMNGNQRRWKHKYTTIVNETDNTGRIEMVDHVYFPPPLNVAITKSSAYGVFSRRFVEYILTDYRASQFLDWCRYTYSPDEHFWATLNNLVDNPILETPGGSQHEDIDQMYLSRIVDWGSGKCRGQYRRGVCVFGAGDLPWLHTRPELVANKFDSLTDSVAYDCIEELLFSRLRNSSLLDEDFYKRRFSSQLAGNSTKL